MQNVTTVSTPDENETAANDFFNAIGKLIISIFGFACIIALRSFVFVILWRWYIEPSFGIAAPKVAVAAGILIISSLFRNSKIEDKKKFNYNTLWISPMQTLMILAMGYVGTFFL